MSKFKVGDRVVSNENYTSGGITRPTESGVITKIYDGTTNQFRMEYPITVAIVEEDGVEGLFAEEELDLV